MDPAALQRKPIVSDPFVIELLHAFSALDRTRPAGFSGDGPISLSEIRAYVQLFGHPSCDMEMFLQLVQNMDTFVRKMRNPPVTAK